MLYMAVSVSAAEQSEPAARAHTSPPFPFKSPQVTDESSGCCRQQVLLRPVPHVTGVCQPAPRSSPPPPASTLVLCVCATHLCFANRFVGTKDLKVRPDAPKRLEGHIGRALCDISSCRCFLLWRQSRNSACSGRQDRDADEEKGRVPTAGMGRAGRVQSGARAVRAAVGAAATRGGCW